MGHCYTIHLRNDGSPYNFNGEKAASAIPPARYYCFKSKLFFYINHSLHQLFNFQSVVIFPQVMFVFHAMVYMYTYTRYVK